MGIEHMGMDSRMEMNPLEAEDSIFFRDSERNDGMELPLEDVPDYKDAYKVSEGAFEDGGRENTEGPQWKEDSIDFTEREFGADYKENRERENPEEPQWKEEGMDFEECQLGADHREPENVEAALEVGKKGGSYGEVFIEGEGDKYEVHHMPADSASYLERYDGPAIKMEKEDHRLTASCGSSREAREYRAQQKELIDGGNFRGAMQMDVDDIHEKFHEKYDDAIAEMYEYVDRLEAEGKING